MTGAMLPRDADAVVMLEKTVERKKNRQTYIKIDHMLHKGENISFQGEDVKKGEVLLKKELKSIQE